MRFSRLTFALSSFSYFQNIFGAPAATSTAGSASLPSSASDGFVVGKDFLSYSIEFRHLPKFTGSESSVNQFSLNLLSNLKAKTGVAPIIRVGGGSGDDAFYNASQSEPEVDLPIPAGGRTPPASIGESYFDSFRVWSGFKFIVQLNLVRQDSTGVNSVKVFAARYCKALAGRLLMYETGNEPDFYAGQGRRQGSWTIAQYVPQWHNYSSIAAAQHAKTCPDIKRAEWFGPSIGTVSASADGFTAPSAFDAGINSDPDTPIVQISSHAYQGVAGNGESLQSTLMNHNSVINLIRKYLTLEDVLPSNIPFTIGEGNSLAGGGAAGLSNSFGASLWVVDSALFTASKGIKRFHYHQSNNAPYNDWNPVTNSAGNKGTNAPYYGKLMAATMIGTEPNVKIINLSLQGGPDGFQSAYAAYDDTGLARVAVLNMKQYNSGSGTRGTRTYAFAMPSGSFRIEAVDLLTAPGADVFTGVTFGGKSYNLDSEGKAKNAQTQSYDGASIGDGVLYVQLANSQGAVIHLNNGGAARRSEGLISKEVIS